MSTMLESYRKERRLSREELAACVGCGVEAIQTIEEGNGVFIKTKDAARIAEALACDLSDIFISCGASCEVLRDDTDEEHDKENAVDLEDMQNICYTSAEELESLWATLAEARFSFPADFVGCLEYHMIQTVEVALRDIIKRLKTV